MSKAKTILHKPEAVKPAPAVPEGKQAKIDLILSTADLPAMKIYTIKAIREAAPELSLQEAKEIVEGKRAYSVPEPAAKPPLFFLRIPEESPTMDPDLRKHLRLAADHLKDQIENLDTVENLAAMDEENNTVRAMSFGIVAVLENFKEVQRHFTEVIALIESEKGGAA